MRARSPEATAADRRLVEQAQALVDAHRGDIERAERLAREADALTEQNDDLNAQGDALCDHRYERKQNLAPAEQTRALLAETARQTAATT